MDLDFAAKLFADYEQGRLTRRQLAARLMGLGAAMATLKGAALGQEAGQGVAVESGAGETQPATATFQATGLDHIALDVTDMARSIDFYKKHLGLRVIRGDENASFLGADRDFFLTLFSADRPQLNHYCYAITTYDPDDAMERAADAGLRPRRTQNRIYFPDPDGLTVQVTG